jgi:hypothetical protein
VALIAGGAWIASQIFGITPLPIILAGTMIGFAWKDPEKETPRP